MPPKQEPVSFDTIIQADRQKKRNEELANRILGKNRRSSAPGPGAGSKPQNATPASLASRIGVTKRSAPVSAKPKKATRTPSAPVRGNVHNPKANNKRRPNESRLISALNPANGQASVRDGPVGLTIKGAGSGPFVVIGSNFAPGTTAADIQSAIEPVSGNVLSCWVTSQHPAVTAEITFAERSAADSAVSNFHNQRADGRVISMRLQSGRAASNSYNAQNSFSDSREQADHQRRLHRGADPAVQDGSYGFGEQTQQSFGRDDGRGNGRNNRRNFGGRNSGRGGRSANQDSNEHGLYSDDMMVDAPPRNSRNRGRGQR